jgi:hypothetical protein
MGKMGKNGKKWEKMGEKSGGVFWGWLRGWTSV